MREITVVRDDGRTLSPGERADERVDGTRLRPGWVDLTGELGCTDCERLVGLDDVDEVERGANAGTVDGSGL